MEGEYPPVVGRIEQLTEKPYRPWPGTFENAPPSRPGAPPTPWTFFFKLRDALREANEMLPLVERMIHSELDGAPAERDRLGEILAERTRECDEARTEVERLKKDLNEVILSDRANLRLYEQARARLGETQAELVRPQRENEELRQQAADAKWSLEP